MATAKADVEAKVGEQVAKIGFSKAMKNKWIRLESDKKSVTRLAESMKDEEKDLLQAYLQDARFESHDKKVVE